MSKKEIKELGKDGFKLDDFSEVYKSLKDDTPIIVEKKDIFKVEEKEVKILPSSLETWNKTYNQLKTMKIFFKQLEQSRYRAAMNEKEISVLMKEKGPKVKLENTDKNKQMQMKLKLHYGNVTALDTDVFLNSANPMLTSGSGLMTAVWNKGGKKLQDRLDDIMEKRKNKPFAVTEFVATKGFQCFAKKIVHMIAPNARAGLKKGQETQLLKCYENYLDFVGKEKGVKNFTMVSLGTGKNGFPLILSAHIALSALRKWFEKDENRKKLDCVVLCVKSSKLHAIYEHLLGFYFPA